MKNLPTVSAPSLSQAGQPRITGTESAELLQQKIASGVDVNAPLVGGLYAGQRPLEIAIRYFQLDQCHLLLAAGAEPEWDVPAKNRVPRYRESALRQLLTKADCDGGEIALFAELLLDAGANPDGTNGLRLHPPMHLAIANGYFEVVDMLVAAGANLGAGGAGQKPVLQEILQRISLHNDIRRANVSQAIVTLLKHGAYDTFVSKDGYTVLQEAVRKGLDPVVLYYAAERGADLAERTSKGTTLIKLARHESTKQVLRAVRTTAAICGGIGAQPAERPAAKLFGKGMAPL